MQVPLGFQRIFSSFPLHSWPSAPESRKPPTEPTLWIHPSNHVDGLSGDVDCLKWQAYLALRGLKNIRVRTDVHPQGAIDHRLPNLHVEGDRLLPPHGIPAWVDEKLGKQKWEGYISEAAQDESRAWVSLLQGHVHAALIFAKHPPSLKETLLEMLSPFPSFTPPTANLQSTVVPMTGFLSLLPPIGIRVDAESINTEYAQAIQALSDRLSTDKWFLGSE
ncbi:hypothetical protein D9758_000749 [Tetrapyrgos nigripes]|uniref:Thioredoxin-like fold domain-containing protein n=1 Tax=Tetrapyrgos nigripes TaxID=182062 RepID=A0A8H5GZ26_9AGAR|nr:hypothetical protein D9758_000749 [Tetrapyrgos nigripes]